jgi:hypothetical protein
MAAVVLAVLLAGVAGGVTWLATHDDSEDRAARGSSPAAGGAGSATGAVAEPEPPPTLDDPIVEQIIEPQVAQPAEGEPGPFGAGAGEGSPARELSRVPGSLVRIDAATGEILASVAIPSPRLLAPDGRSVWVLGGEDGSEQLARMDTATNAVTATFDASAIPESGLTVTRGAAWLNDEHGMAYRVATRAGAAEDVSFAELNFAEGQFAAGGSLWVSGFEPGPCCTRPPDLYRVDPTTLEVIARIEDATEVVAAGRGFVWALGERVLGNQPELVRIDTETHTTAPIGVLDFPWADLAVADGAVWASSPEDGTIVRLDPLTGEEQERIGVGGAPRALAAGGGAVWAAIRSGTVARYDIATGEIERFDVGGTANGLVFARGSVWVAVDEPAPQGEPEPPPDAETVGAGQGGCGQGGQTAPFSPEPAGAVTIVADYRCNGSLSSSVGDAPDLAEVGEGFVVFDRETVRGRSRPVLEFARRSGLALTPTASVVDDAEYTIEFLFRFRRIGGFRKIVDFSNGSSDNGLYSLDGCLNLFPTVPSGRAMIEAGSYVHVVLTRDVLNRVEGYVNGVRQFSLVDPSGLAMVDASDTLRFFSDDVVTSGEYSRGAVARIRLYDGPLREGEVVRACAELMGEGARRACG